MAIHLLAVKKILTSNYPSLKDSYALERIGIFGSLARGDTKGTSDIDILVEFSRPISLYKFIELEERLKELLKNDVDVTTVNSLKPLIKDTILRETTYV